LQQQREGLQKQEKLEANELSDDHHDGEAQVGANGIGNCHYVCVVLTWDKPGKGSGVDPTNVRAIDLDIAIWICSPPASKKGS
jgi:hypothetical protein